MYSIPKPTLKRYIKVAPASMVKIGHPTDLPLAIEKELYQHRLLLECMFYGLSRKDVMKLAFEIAERNKIKKRFNLTKHQRVKNGLKHHPELSLRMKESLSFGALQGTIFCCQEKGWMNMKSSTNGLIIL